VLKIGEGAPSTTAILENAHGLARYAQIAQASSSRHQMGTILPSPNLHTAPYKIQESEGGVTAFSKLLVQYPT